MQERRLRRLVLATSLIILLLPSLSLCSLRAYWSFDDISNSSSTGDALSGYCSQSVGPLVMADVSLSSSPPLPGFGSSAYLDHSVYSRLDSSPFSISSPSQSVQSIGTFSFSLWVYLDTSTRQFSTLVSNDDPETEFDFYFERWEQFAVRWNPTCCVDFYLFDGGLSPSEFKARFEARWVHLVLVYDTARVSLYVDGVLFDSEEADVPGSPYLEPPGTTWSFGCRSGTQFRTLDGYMDELMIFDHPLTASEIDQMYGRRETLALPVEYVISSSEATNDTFDVIANFDTQFQVSPTNSTWSYQWDSINTGDCTNGGTISGATTSNPTISLAEVGATSLSVEVTIGDGLVCIEQSVTLNVKPLSPFLLEPLGNETMVIIGENTSLVAKVGGSPAPFITWQEMEMDDVNRTRRREEAWRRTRRGNSTNTTNTTTIWIPLPSNGGSYTFIPSPSDTGRIVRVYAYNSFGQTFTSDPVTLTAIEPSDDGGGGGGDDDGSTGGKTSNLGGPIAGGTLGAILLCLLLFALPLCCIVVLAIVVLLGAGLLVTIKSRARLAGKLQGARALWEIDYEELELLAEEELGSGAFGTVHRGTFRECEVAIKQLKLEGDAVEQFKAEATVMKNLRAHLNVVRLYGVCVHPDHPTCLVTEYCAGGDVQGYVRANGRPEDPLFHRWVLDIAAGMTHLVKEGIIHRDLAARNLLLTNDLTVKIADFGMSSAVPDVKQGGVSSSNVGPLKWMSPELLKHRVFSEKSDVYAYGITLWEIAMDGQVPYAGMDAVECAHAVVDDGLRPDAMKPNVHMAISVAMENCWRQDPEERPTFHEIYKRLKRELDGNIAPRRTSIYEAYERDSNEMMTGIGSSRRSTLAYPDDGSAVSYSAMSASPGEKRRKPSTPYDDVF